MFCPKCGTRNPDDGKFCRSCGADLAVVTEALSGGQRRAVDAILAGDDRGSGRRSSRQVREAQKLLARTDPDEAWSAGIRQTVLGIGFLIISMVLFFTNVAGGSAWWWAMLFPGFGTLATGLGSLARARRLERRRSVGFAPGAANDIAGGHAHPSLAGGQADFISADSSYRTGDLAPPSVVEATTRHLSMENEGETATLPKK